MSRSEVPAENAARAFPLPAANPGRGKVTRDGRQVALRICHTGSRTRIEPLAQHALSITRMGTFVIFNATLGINETNLSPIHILRLSDSDLR